MFHVAPGRMTPAAPVLMHGAKGFRQHGQALPLAVVMLLAVAATLYFMFNSGQLVQEKIRLTNTADAVAYSAGVFEARVLNYDAYTNRAIIANEIAIGHAVGLASWTKYAATTSENIAPYMYLIPYAGPAIASALDAFATYADAYTHALAAAVSLHDAALQALSLSQFVMHGPGNSVAYVSRLSLMKDIAKKNDPDVEVDPIPLVDTFSSFTERHASRDDRKRLGQLVHDSRDAFLRSRNWSLGLVVLCHGVELRKRGSTELIDLTEGWKSMDTLSAHVYRIRRLRCRHSEVPIGYGTAYSEEDLDDSAYSYAGSRGTNPYASSLAEGNVANGFAPYTIGGGAIPAFQELSKKALNDMPSDPRATLTVRVTKEAGSQRYSGGNSIIKPQGRLARYGGDHAKGISAATASVEVYFERPDGENPLFGKHEYGSLFNPYWQVRLAPISAATRALAQGLQGRLTP